MNKDALKRIEALERRVTYLENKPAVYVPPPVYGPLSRTDDIEVPEIDWDKVLEENPDIKKQIKALSEKAKQ